MAFKKPTRSIGINHQIIAWDIETCPIPDDHLAESHYARIAKEVRVQCQRSPHLPEAEVIELVRGTHPFLSWICCISAVGGTLGQGPRTPISFSAASLGKEKTLLESFWALIGSFPGNPIFVTFNGKRFDVPFLLARSAHHRVRPTRQDLTDTYPYSHQPHADLLHAWPYAYTLDDMCTLLDVASPKNGFNGGDVADAVEAGELARVVAYCSDDVRATWECYRQLFPYL